VRLAYGPNLGRLLALVRRYDPDVVFSAVPTLRPVGGPGGRKISSPAGLIRARNCPVPVVDSASGSSW
jgi:hypothetical protein